MLVDTSIWVEHLRHGQLGLVSLLHRAEVQCHPFIIGELACGSINRRSEILQLLRRLPSVPVVENEEVMTFVERHRLMGRGVGWVDVHLLASAVLESVLLWSADRRLAAIARSLGVYGEPWAVVEVDFMIELGTRSDCLTEIFLTVGEVVERDGFVFADILSQQFTDSMSMGRGKSWMT
jgi:predicted nucleic acid-binding protein